MSTLSDSCPGSKILKSPVPEMYVCPNCGEEVEIWTHELKRNCLKCGTPVFRPQKSSCLDWCKMARECVGEETYNRLKGEKAK